jgi:hypothetical protein
MTNQEIESMISLELVYSEDYTAFMDWLMSNFDIKLKTGNTLVYSTNTKNSACRLGRFPAACSIINNTSFKTCAGCGHQC